MPRLGTVKRCPRRAGQQDAAAGAIRVPAGRDFAGGTGVRAWRRGPRSPGRFAEARPVPAGPQPAHCQRRPGEQVCVHAEDRVDDAIHDQAPRACRAVVPDHRAEVLRPDSLTDRICRRRGITHAELVSIGKAIRAPDCASSLKSCQETVDFPTPAGPQSHRTGTMPPGIDAEPGRRGSPARRRSSR